jgi:hypothetical protein
VSHVPADLIRSVAVSQQPPTGELIISIRLAAAGFGKRDLRSLQQKRDSVNCSDSALNRGSPHYILVAIGNITAGYIVIWVHGVSLVVSAWESSVG